MKVTLLTTSLGWGGTERYVVDLAEALTPLGVKTRVIVDEPPTDRLSRLDSAGVETIIIGRRFLSGRDTYTNRLTEVLQCDHPDVVHLNNWVRGEWIASALSRLKLPALRTDHCTHESIRVRDVLGVSRRPFNWYRQLIQAQRFPTPAISISNRSLENLRRRMFGLVRSVVIYNGIKVAATMDAPQNGDGKNVVWVGSMIARKRPLLAIEVIERAAILRPGISLVMVGDGPLLEAARRRAASVRSARIEFRGNISNVLDEMALSSVFLQTSTIEGISFALLEAMSVALPVLATNVGATAEAVLNGETGYLVGAKATATQIASKLLCLLDNQDFARRLGDSGFDRCIRTFSLDRMVAETLQIYSACSVSPPGFINLVEPQRKWSDEKFQVAQRK